MTYGCHCGYPFPRVGVNVATRGEPTERVIVHMECPACGCWHAHDLSLKGRVESGVATAPPIATNARGGNA